MIIGTSTNGLGGRILVGNFRLIHCPDRNIMRDFTNMEISRVRIIGDGSSAVILKRRARRGFTIQAGSVIVRLSIYNALMNATVAGPATTRGGNYTVS
jgi:hypothetical protein